jgi:electron transport complex protein RnfC
MKTLKAKFRSGGGVHPACRKEATQGLAVETLPLPGRLNVSMSQHMGAPAEPVVKKGDTVLRGQLIGQAAGFISAAVHAPTSGTVKAVADAATAAGTVAKEVTIEPDGEDRWTGDPAPRPDWQSMQVKDLVGLIADAGIAGMGGAGFPTHVKLAPPPNKPIDTLIINGAECEPYLTADHRLMIEEADRIWAGGRVIRRILGAKTVRIAIEDNKPDAIAAMERAIHGAEGDVAVVVLKSEYPRGAEKQQILAITGREVPSGGLPMDVGAVVENVGTTAAIWDAVDRGYPLVERITTVSGPPVRTPRNVLARIGTSFRNLVEFCGGAAGPAVKVICGGPMMGLAQHSLEVSTTKTTSGLLLLGPEALTLFTSMPCISCGRCVEACVAGLMPNELSRMIEAEDYEAAAAYSVMDCIECGCCAFVCPAHRPLVQHMRQGKAWVMGAKREQQ